VSALVVLLLVAVVAASTIALTVAPAGNATNECRGITACIRVAGPWVVVPPKRTVHYLLSCPNGRGVVAGLDAQATSRAGRVSFEGRIGAPVSPGVTTTRYALFNAVSTSPRTEAFRPLLGCVPTQGGGGRTTVSARVTPTGPALELRSRIVVIGPGTVQFGRTACLPEEALVGSWSEISSRPERSRHVPNAALPSTNRHWSDGGGGGGGGRPAVGRRPRDRPGRGGVRAMSFPS
jgi:hypothetical protein